MMYVWIAVAVVVLFLIGRIIRWWNLPKVVEARAQKAEARARERTERVRIRHNRRAKKLFDKKARRLRDGH